MSEHQRNNTDAARRHRLNEWDAVPRDGPAALVVDASPYDEAGEIHGGWIDLNQPEPQIETAVQSAVGREAWDEDRWVIIDQVGLGSVMLAERLSVHGLARVAQALRGGTR
jgi:hypothetical protein